MHLARKCLLLDNEPAMSAPGNFPQLTCLEAYLRAPLICTTRTEWHRSAMTESIKASSVLLGTIAILSTPQPPKSITELLVRMMSTHHMLLERGKSSQRCAYARGPKPALEACTCLSFPCWTARCSWLHSDNPRGTATQLQFSP